MATASISKRLRWPTVNNTATHGHTRTYTNAEKRCNEISVDRLDRLYLYSPQAEQPNDGAQRRVGKGSKNLNFRANGVPLFFLNKKFDKTYFCIHASYNPGQRNSAADWIVTVTKLRIIIGLTLSISFLIGQGPLTRAFHPGVRVVTPPIIFFFVP